VVIRSTARVDRLALRGEAEAQRRGLPLVAVHEDAGISGKSLARPGLTAALADLDAGQGTVLLVAKLDRLSPLRARRHGAAAAG